jgi:Transglutaminase-like superfamily
VDSPIDEAIESCQGVCQDFAHIMIALVRRLKIPCRYVSGYLYRSAWDHDRSVVDATHAWVEAFLPPLGWVGFDPTNCLLAGDRHIRTAIGRDYADVPPTRGIFRGQTPSELSVAVRVTASIEPPELEHGLPVPEEWSLLVEKAQEPPPFPPRTCSRNNSSNNRTSSKAGARSAGARAGRSRLHLRAFASCRHF